MSQYAIDKDLRLLRHFSPPLQRAILPMASWFLRGLQPALRDNRYTCAVLHRMGFHWSEPDGTYISRMLTAISGLGFFEV